MRILVTALLTFCATAAAAFGPLIDPADVEGAQIVDIRPAEAFAEGHIQGAVNLPYGQWRGPAENPGRVPAIEDLEAMLEAAGLDPAGDVAVVHAGANATDFGSAARVYWTLKSAGYSSLAVVNGGYAAWSAEGVPTTAATETAPIDLDLTWSEAWSIDADGVGDVVSGAADAVLIDARPLEFFEGDRKHGAAAQAGTLAGALNIVHSTWFRERSPRLDAPDEMLDEVRRLAAANPGTPFVSFCNTGHWAATNWFAVSELAGVEAVKLYPESMVGWTRLGGTVVRGN